MKEEKKGKRDGAKAREEPKIEEGTESNTIHGHVPIKRTSYRKETDGSVRVRIKEMDSPSLHISHSDAFLSFPFSFRSVAARLPYRVIHRMGWHRDRSYRLVEEAYQTWLLND